MGPSFGGAHAASPQCSRASALENLSRVCPDDLGYASTSEYFDALGIVGDPELGCVEGVLETEDDAVLYLNCVNSAFVFFEQCLEINASCEPGEHQVCSDNYGVALAECDQVPTSSAASVELCVTN